MDGVAALSADDRQALFQEVAARRGLAPVVIEKDFWVCWTLRRVFELQSLGGALIFKGGTSLSKVFGLIERFSEDIDLSIRREYLGAVKDQDPEQDGISQTQRKKRVEALRDYCHAAVRDQMAPALKSAFISHLNMSTDSSWKLERDPLDAGTLLFTYPSVLSNTNAPVYIWPQVKLEMGAGSDPYPIGCHSVRSYGRKRFRQHSQNPKSLSSHSKPSGRFGRKRRFFMQSVTGRQTKCRHPDSHVTTMTSCASPRIQSARERFPTAPCVSGL